MRHLTKRFFGAIASRRLSPTEQAWVNHNLPNDLAQLFWQQAVMDQRHAYQVAQRTEGALGANPAAVQAALLHDVGKRHSRAGAVGRALATIVDTLRLPLPGDWRRYRDHEELGADELRQHGADPLAIAFAAGRRPAPDQVESGVWEALIAADNM